MNKISTIIFLLLICFGVGRIDAQNAVTYWKNGESAIIYSPDSIHFDYESNKNIMTLWFGSKPTSIINPDSIYFWNSTPFITNEVETVIDVEPTPIEEQIMEMTSDEETSEFTVYSESDSLEYDNLAQEVLSLFTIADDDESEEVKKTINRRNADSQEDLAEEAIRKNGKNIFNGIIIEQQDWNSGTWGKTHYGGFETFYNTYEKYGRRYLLVVFYHKGGFPYKRTAYLKLGQVNSGKIIAKSTISTGQEYTFLSVCIDDYLGNYGCVNFYPLLITEKSNARHYLNPIFVKTDPLISSSWRDQYYKYEFGKINGVSVYFNNDSQKGNSNQGDGGYQCVELCKRYVKELNDKIDRKYSATWGNAKQWPDKRANDDVDPGEYLVLANDGYSRVREGDLIVWNYGSFGHIGVVIKTTKTYISVAHQNGGVGTNALPIGSTLKIEDGVVKDIRPGSNKSPIFKTSHPISHFIRINSPFESYDSYDQALTASTTNMKFGASVGSSKTKTFTIKNNGLYDLTISSCDLTKGDVFSIDIPTYTIAPGKEETFNVTFTPSASGEFKDRIIINSNAEDNPVWVIHLTGKATGDASEARVQMLSQSIGSYKYSIYKEIIDESDYHENPDGWKCYRSKLTLDITKNGITSSYVVDDNIYLDKETQHHGGQVPCMMIDYNKGMMYIFCNSKDEQPYYSMDGNFYSSSINDVNFTKETVFEGANWGWYPYFRDSDSDEIHLCNFSYAGYFTILAVRGTSNEWTLYYDNPEISPENATAEWEQADHILVVGNP